MAKWGIEKKWNMGKRLTDNNRLSITFPEDCLEWDYEKNGGLTPDEVSYSSGKKVWWKCKHGHSWECKITDRIRLERMPKCPICHSFGFKFPELLNEWDYLRNKIDPFMILSKSNVKVWWKCKYGHSWEAQVCSKTNSPLSSSCPYCCNRLINDTNNLMFQYPKIAIEWNDEKNGDLKSYAVVSGSLRKVWWKCKYGHEWKARVCSRTKDGHSCPYCEGNAVCIDNCLATKYPALAKMWHPSKNASLTPFDITGGCNKKIWWICPRCNNEFMASANDCRRSKIGCKSCYGVRLEDGTICASMVEAYFYLCYKEMGIKFKHDCCYGGIKKRYDFFLIDENKYVEVTAYNSSYIRYISYLRNIVFKKRYVKNILKANFEFIQTNLTIEQIIMVRNNCK
jgi:hypothetical protein